jgi:hypothetical protein
MRSSTVLSLPPQLVFPDTSHSLFRMVVSDEEKKFLWQLSPFLGLVDSVGLGLKASEGLSVKWSGVNVLKIISSVLKFHENKLACWHSTNIFGLV